MRKLLVMIYALFLVVSLPTAAQSQTAHPRLWITPTTLEKYRAWANDTNPLYAESLLPLAERAKEEMDAGDVIAGDFGSNAYEDYVTENYATLFAFMSLIHPDEAQRADYAARSRTMLMHVITEAAKGAADGEPFRSPEFSINDRSRWYGVSFPLTVDWIYPSLTADDKALIHTVFSAWMNELTYAATTNMNHPEPVGVYNDPALISDVDAVRWSGNNYYTAHMRNMGMMALAFDPADDPEGTFAGYLQQATGAWLYVNDHLMRTDAAGGFGTEGFEYSPQSLGYVAQFLLALHTAGADDTTRFGQQVAFASNPFWDDSVKAYFHSLSPTTTTNSDTGQSVYEPAWYGSGQNYLNPDFIELFGAIGLYDANVNNAERLNAIRWLQIHTPMGGEEALADRSNDPQEFYKTLLYFMLIDPATPAPTDPRPAYPTTWYAPGMRRLLSRTNWSDSAAWLTYSLSWDRVDHQTGNGNSFEFYYGGEWLTKIRVGYDLDYLTSDNLNTLTVQNDPTDRSDHRLMISERGSQWLYSANNPPQPLYSDTKNYLYVQGDSTALYNTDYEELHGVTHVSRSLLWLKPNIVIVYDRATTASDDREKRFWLNFANDVVVDGNQAVMTTPKNQQLLINSVLPTDAVLTAAPLQDEISSAPAHYETMRYRLNIDGGSDADVRFLTVLQAMGQGSVDAGAISFNCDGGYEGVELIDIGVSVVFARDLDQPFTNISCELPTTISKFYVAGLLPSSTYDIINNTGSPNKSITITAGTAYTADQAGLLDVFPSS